MAWYVRRRLLSNITYTEYLASAVAYGSVDVSLICATGRVAVSFRPFRGYPDYLLSGLVRGCAAAYSSEIFLSLT